MPSTVTVTKRVPFASATAIQQQITAAGHFDGSLPQSAGKRADSPIFQPGNSIYKYAPAAAGGLFFWNTVEPLVCSQIHISSPTAMDITVKLVNLDAATLENDLPAAIAGEVMTIEAVSAQTFLALDEARFKTLLLPNQAIQIITTANADVQIAQVIASLERMYVR